MSLPSQVIPISLYKGIDSKQDEKNSLPGELNILENGVFTNPGKISKRNGFSILPRTALNGNISTGKALSSYNSELVQFTGREVLGFSEAENTWINRGFDYSLTSESRSIVNNHFQQRNPEVHIAFGLELYVWEDSSGGVRYSLIDNENKSILVANQQVDFYGFRPKVVEFQNKFAILYSAKKNIFVRTISPDSPFAISNPIPLLTDVDSTGAQFDCVVSDNGFFWLGYAQVKDGVDGYACLALVPSLVASSVIKSSHRINAKTAVNVFLDDSDNAWFLTSGLNQLYVCVVIAPDGTVKSAGFPIKNNIQANRMCGYQNSLSDNIVIFYEQNITSNFGFGSVIHKVNLAVNGTVFSSVVFKRGVGLYSKAFKYGNDYFVTLSTDSPLQSTYYLVNEAGSFVDRSNVNNGGGNKNPSFDTFPVGVCTDVVNPDPGLFLIPFQVKTTIESNDNTIFLPTGINVDEFDFNSAKAFSNVTTNEYLAVSGGIFRSYDGVNYTENNFFQYPEGFFSDATQLSVIIAQHGNDGIIFQITRFIFPPAYSIKPNSYLTIDSTSQHYYIWFRINGIGVDPMPGGSGITVDINNTDSSTIVSQKFAAQIGLSEFTASTFANVVIVVNKAVGKPVPDATTGNMNSGNMQPGTYLYNVLYSWLDNNGIIQRGETAVPISVVVGSGNGSITIVFPTLRLSEKTDVRIEVYRTENLGSTIFYRVSPLGDTIINDPTIDYMSFVDTNSDAQILANDFIYTTGGVVDNTAPPSSSIITLFKNRIFIGGLDDKNLLWFSKYFFSGTPVQFSELFTFKCSPVGGDITALGVLDDKLIIFKQSAIFCLIGNGPDDTGNGNDYDAGAVMIATDLGCSEPNSIVITPNGLMFKSNKGLYLLNRSLETSYIGAQVENFNSLTISSAVLSPNNNQVRFTTENQMLVFDYYSGQWGTFTNLNAVDAHFVDNIYYLLKPDGIVYKEEQNLFTDAGKQIKLKIQTGWITLSGIGRTSGIQGFQRIRRALFLGSYKGSHILQASFNYDYNDSPEEFTQIDATTLIGDNEPWGSDGYWGKIGTVWGGSFLPYQWRVHLTKQKCEAIRITLEDIQTGSFNEGFDLSNIALEVAVKQGPKKLPVKSSFGNG